MRRVASTLNGRSRSASSTYSTRTAGSSLLSARASVAVREMWPMPPATDGTITTFMGPPRVVRGATGRSGRIGGLLGRREARRLHAPQGVEGTARAPQLGGAAVLEDFAVAKDDDAVERRQGGEP